MDTAVADMATSLGLHRGWVGRCAAAVQNGRHLPVQPSGAEDRALTAEPTNMGFAERTEPHRGALVDELIREITTFGPPYFAVFDLPAVLP